MYDSKCIASVLYWLISCCLSYAHLISTVRHSLLVVVVVVVVAVVFADRKLLILYAKVLLSSIEKKLQDNRLVGLLAYGWVRADDI